MQFRFPYIILFLFFTAKFFCQDIIVKKDSTRTEAKILEVRSTEIKYKLFNYQDGSDIIISKNEIAYAIYSNGIKEVFKSEESDITNIMYDQIPKKGSVKRPDSIGNYIKFNIQVATVVYNSFSNVPRKNYSGMTSSDKYKQVSTKQNIALNIGFNFVFGKSPYVKHVIGVNYLKTKGEYYYDYGGIGYSSHAKYKTDVDFVNVVTGFRFTVFKKLHIEPFITLNFVAKGQTKRSGTENTVNQQTYIWTTTSFENQPANTLIETTISLSPKISYELPIKKIKIEAYAAYNLAYQYRLPWYQFGVHIFPFKKLR